MSPTNSQTLTSSLTNGITFKKDVNGTGEHKSKIFLPNKFGLRFFTLLIIYFFQRMAKHHHSMDLMKILYSVH